MSKINKKMLQNSLLCAPKGSVIFVMGLLNVINGLATLPVDKDKGKIKVKQGLYAMYHNLIPFLEVVVVMGGISWIAKLILNSNPLIPKIYISIITPIVCLLAMVSICLSLRATDLRSDCCSDFDYKSSYEQKDDISIQFKIPTNEQKRNSQILKFEICKFDKWTEWLGLDQRSTGEKDTKKSVKAIDFINRMILSPFFVALLIMQIVELPLRFGVDAFCYFKNGRDTKEFESTKDFIKNDMKFSVRNALFFLPSSIFTDAKVEADIGLKSPV